MSVRADFKNKAHRTAFDAGQKARLEGKERFAPYGTDNRASLHFRKAWLCGYDAPVAVPSIRVALEQLTDVVKRCDPETLPDGALQATDEEWDNAIAIADLALAGAP